MGIKVQLGKHHDLIDVYEAITVYGAGALKPETPRLFDRNGKEIMDIEEANEIAANGGMVWLIEKGAQDKKASAVLFWKDANGAACASDSITVNPEKMADILSAQPAPQKPGAFKRFMHSLFSKAYPEVQEYYQKSAKWEERTKVVEQFKASREKIIASPNGPSIGTVRDSDMREIAKFKNALRMDDFAQSKSLQFNGRKKVSDLSDDEFKKLTDENIEFFKYVSTMRGGAFKGARAFPKLEGKELFGFEKVLENSLQARAGLFEKMQAAGKGNPMPEDAKNDLVDIFEATYIASLIERAEHDHNAEAELKWLRDPAHREELRDQISEAITNAGPKTPEQVMDEFSTSAVHNVSTIKGNPEFLISLQPAPKKTAPVRNIQESQMVEISLD